MLVNKYYQTLEIRVKNLLYSAKDDFVEDEDIYGSGIVDHAVQAIEEVPQESKDSIVMSSNYDGTHLLNTNTYSIATTLLQEKVERLEREKKELLETRNLEGVLRNNWTDNGSQQRQGSNANNNRVDLSAHHNRSEIKHIEQFSHEDGRVFKPSFESAMPSEPLKSEQPAASHQGGQSQHSALE